MGRIILDGEQRELTEEEVMRRLHRDAGRLVDQFRLPLARLAKEGNRVKRRYGSCDSDGVIRIRLLNQRTGKILKYSSMISTLCHELAHLRHFDHGPRFKAFYFRLLDFARAEGIYQPRRAGLASEPVAASPARAVDGSMPAEPSQLELF